MSGKLPAVDKPSHPIKQESAPIAAEGPSSLAVGMMLAVLGCSAGLTLYTRKTGSMLRRMEQAREVQLHKHPPRVGPPTKIEWEKTRTRFDKADDFF